MLKQFNIATDQMDVDAFQQRMERTVGKINSNAIAQLKSAWIGAGYNINLLSTRIKELYNCGINDLSEIQVDDLLAKIKGKRSESA